MKYNFPATGVGGPAVLARLAQEHFAKVTAHVRYTSHLDTELAGEEEQQRNQINYVSRNGDANDYVIGGRAADFTNDNVVICVTILGTVQDMFLCIDP
ncbi:unnamed protein product [Sphagnum tenellum]